MTGIWREEFGVMEDRRGQGLGIRLAHVRSRRDGAEVAAEGVRQSTDNPVFVQRRMVWLGDWEDTWMDGLAHVPECNERCDATGHWLRGESK